MAKILLTTSQAAQALDMSSSTLSRLAELGAPFTYSGGGVGLHKRWDLRELRTWLAEQEEEDDEDLGDNESSGDQTEDDSPDEDGGDEEADEPCPTCGAEPGDDDDSSDDLDDGSSDDLDDESDEDD